MSDFAAYRFLPWVRTGFRPTTEDPLDGSVPDPSRFDLTVDVTGRGEAGETTEDESVTLSMYGPGEVTGIDGRQVVRREPEPNTPDFTPNYFPVVEFDQPDLPWLFSPAKSDGQGRVRPWVALVTVEQRGGVTLGTAGDRNLQVLEWASAADPTRDLPDLSESWAWAHSQVVGGPDTTTTEQYWVGAQLDDNTTAAVSRLVSPRRLAPKTSYWACVVPTFEPGRRVGLGEDLSDDSGIGPAWNHETETGPFRLPVYLSWEFTTGAAGDFESLVRRLDPTTLSGIGVRAMDASHPGPAELEEHRPRDISLDGALTSVGLDRTDYPERNRDDLADLLAETGWTAEDTADPTLGPPVYARYHADAPAVPAAPTGEAPAPWLRQLNLEPRARVAAGLGAAVVRDRQESLMTSAWKQIGDVRRANQLLERAQLARAASRKIHDDVRALSGPDLLAVTAPLHGRVRRADGGGATTISTHLAESCLPRAAVSTEFRRLTRPAGPLGTRLSTTAALEPDAVVGRLNDPSFLLETETPPDGTNDLQGDDSGTEPDLTAAACRRIGQRANPRTGGWTPEMVSPIDPDDVVDVLEEVCEEGRQEVTQARDRLDDASPVIGVLRTIGRRCAVLCGEGGPVERYARAVNAVDGASSPAAAARAERDAIAALADVIEALEAAKDALEPLERFLAGDPALSGDAIEELQATYTALREYCTRASDTVRDRAYDHLTMLCAQLDPVVTELDELVDTGDAADRVDGLVDTVHGICGPANASSSGLLETLDAHLSGSWLFESVTALFADLQRLVALASDRAAALAANLNATSSGDEAAALAELFADFETHLDAVAEGIAEIPRDPIRERLQPTLCGSPPSADPSAGTPLPSVRAGGDLHTRLVEATDPARTVPARIADRVGGLDLHARDDPLDRVMAAPEFPQPMYAALRDYGQQYFLPGSGDVPPESIGLLETNPAFVEAYMAGLSHEFARELQWREYPTDKRGTYFRQFWDVAGRVPPITDANREAFTDIDPIHEWPVGDNATPLGGNLKDKPGGGDDAGTNLVVTIRGDLLRRYPNTIIYLVEGSWEDGERVPAIESDEDAPDPSADYVRYPQFQGELDPDIRFLGFALTAHQAVGSTAPADDDPGWFVVIEEAPGEPRFGLDVNDDDIGTVPAGIATDTSGPRSPDEGEESGWDALSWGHVVPPGSQSADDPFAGLEYVPVDDTAIDDDGWSDPSSPVDWGHNGAHVAAITWQPPVRIAIHADDMIDTEEL